VSVGDTPVLIVGAGPTGLALAHRLARHRVAFRIIDQNPGPGTASRAMVVQARTLEFYQQLGLADGMVALGIRIDAGQFRSSRAQPTRINFGDLGAGLSPFPFVLSLAQDEHERFLVDRLADLGKPVEWKTRLVSYREQSDGVHVTLENGDGTEALVAQYLCGCDGAHSTVRQQLGLDFPGGTYHELFFVADVHTDRELAHEFIGTFDEHTLALMFPVRRTGMQRLIGIVPRELRQRDAEADVIEFDDVRPYAEELLDITVERVNWFSTYRVHHRVAANFRVGRVFIAGDAAHIHSPAGGQGMNTGIGDAVNLSWKLAHVLQERIDPAVLDTYEAERIPFARSLVHTTDRAFELLIGRRWSARFFRTMLVPHVLPLLMRFARTRRALFRLISQTRISYGQSALSRGHAGDVQAGDRLPWLADEGSNNFQPLQSLDWQLHVYGVAQPGLRALADSARIPLHQFDWSAAAEHAGFARNALYLVRPDAHVALAAPVQDPARLRAYVSRWRINPAPYPHPHPYP